jgi:basic amino acid/polyamine antiporter, APA family
MFGTGIFINSVVLAQRAGFFGFIGYPIIALLGLPLILTFTKLVAHFPHGGFYTYGANTMGPFFGFMAAWSYSIGKLASGGLMAHVFVILMQSIIPDLKNIHPLLLDVIIIFIMTWANLFHIKTARNITYAFVACKVIPALFVIITGIVTICDWNVPQSSLMIEGIPSLIPLVLYAFSGFEICCSLSRSIKDPQINMPKAIFYSYVFSLSVSTFYQLMFFLSTGPDLILADSFLQAFPLLIQNAYHATPSISMYIVRIAHLAAAASALGGSYGILFSAHWNIYELARHNHLPYAKNLLQLNSHNIPKLTLSFAALSYVLFLIITGLQQVVLQQIASLGLSITYLTCVSSYFFIPTSSKLIGILALFSCLLFGTSCVHSLLYNGTESLVVFIFLVIVGAICYVTTSIYKSDDLT